MTWDKPPVPLYITYTDPDGQVWDLSDRSFAKGYVCSAISGIEGLPVMMQGIPLLDGTTVPTIYLPQTGTIGIAILVGRPSSGDQEAYYDLLDGITTAFYNRRNQNPAPGTLTIRRPDGTTRNIQTYTTSGLNTPDVGINDMTLYSFALSTPDPYWSDVVAESLLFQLPQNAGILPVLPVVLDGPNVIGDVTIDYFGKAPSYPTWTIVGPGTPTMTNHTTGRSWGLNTAIAAGKTVVVETKRGKQYAINITDNINIWNQLVFSGPHDLWPLAEGENKITVSMANATTASSVNMQYFNRWVRA